MFLLIAPEPTFIMSFSRSMQSSHCQARGFMYTRYNQTDCDHLHANRLIQATTTLPTRFNKVVNLKH